MKLIGKKYKTRPGHRYPPGASLDDGGVNFSVFSRHATSVELLLYHQPDSPEPFQVLQLDPEVNRTFFYWHVYVEGLPAGVSYTWCVGGPDDTSQSGLRFDRNFELLDPWARAVTHLLWDRRGVCRRRSSDYTSMRGIVIDNDYDWEGDRPINHPLEKSVIYEMHVGGFTRHPSSGVASPGTFAGVIEKIPYLKELGVTDVELLPVMAFDEQEVPENAAKLGLRNYWGYMTHSFFSPHPGYCISPEAGSHQREFRDMVKALHRAGIGVILDVVFNHTAEGGEGGPNMNFKGLCNEAFYHLDNNDRSRYRDYTGCGNTVNCNHPFVSSFIISCLEYWVREMHVDGFRFDLASVLARGEDGLPMKHAPILWNIEFSDVLAHSKIIAEAWDVGGLYQVGDFPGYRWAEWNGRYRDVLRQFVHGGKGLIGEVATRISGSSDLYQPDGKMPVNSINYITCHDGLTLHDLVSYGRKHNEANGEASEEESSGGWNCGAEGKTEDPEVLAVRNKQVRNFMAVLMLSQGVPMIQAGDEVLRTQRGNDNAYCQDNDISWFDWSMLKKNHDMFRFVKEMIAFRRRHPCLMRTRFFTGYRRNGRGMVDITWYGKDIREPQWDDPEAGFLAFSLGALTEKEEDIHVILNMSEQMETVQLPRVHGRVWHVTVDTGKASPIDIHKPSDRQPVKGHVYPVLPRSVVVLESLPAANQIKQ
ncbi:MAG: glycogen debranching protein GlgX [Nitrospirota bacterium]|nr:glycogen debranching protein GlgX [Nitrospirota bacterium]